MKRYYYTPATFYEPAAYEEYCCEECEYYKNEREHAADHLHEVFELLNKGNIDLKELYWKLLDVADYVDFTKPIPEFKDETKEIA